MECAGKFARIARRPFGEARIIFSDSRASIVQRLQTRIGHVSDCRARRHPVMLSQMIQDTLQQEVEDLLLLQRLAQRATPRSSSSPCWSTPRRTLRRRLAIAVRLCC